jgi:integrase
MALRKRGKAGYWHAYFDTIRETEDGPRRVRTTINLGTADKSEARALESELMRKNREAILRKRVERILSSSEFPNSSPVPERVHRKRRLLIQDALDVAKKYRVVGATTGKIWRKFQREINLKWMHELTSEQAYAYLDEHCPGESGKRFNNVRSCLNTVYQLTLMESGLAESPFAKIPQRRLQSKHQRPFTQEEFVRIYEAAQQPWKSAALIAWFTGLREKDIFLLRWDCIEGDVLTTVPAKTARFGRGVRIPIHPQLAAELAALPHVNERVLGAWKYTPDYIRFRRAFGEILRGLGIQADERGIVNFNSLRDSFVTRCDEAGIPRHAIRGIVGHTSDRMTDLYSHDLETARLVQGLPSVPLDKQEKNTKTCARNCVKQ